MRARWLAVAAAAGLGVASGAAAQMALPGSFEVSETGAAVYTIPIAVPPGSAGLEPKLTLQYNSRAGNGLLGVGWTLGGLPNIVRCPTTIAQDGARGGIAYDVNDRFCLEGERLVAISGTYGADGTEYRTEREGFSKIVSYGSAGTGPAWFKVWTKAGQILEFGNTADSRIEAQGKATARLWAVNRVSDTAANSFTVTYAEDNANGEYRPTRIDYTGNAAASISPYASVRFVYETRPATDQTPLYEAGSLIKTTQRLAKVQSYVGESLVREYRLTYDQSAATQQSRLTAVALCAADNTCLPSSSFSSTGNPPTMFAGAYDWQSPAGWCGACTVLLADFNGDGKTDIYFHINDGRNIVWLNQGNGTFSTSGFDWQSPVGWCGVCDVLLGDFNGDGKPDIYFHTNDGRNIVWLNRGGGTFPMGDSESF